MKLCISCQRVPAEGNGDYCRKCRRAICQPVFNFRREPLRADWRAFRTGGKYL